MKTILSALPLTAGLALAGPADYVNFIRQVQRDTGVEWDVPVGSYGSIASEAGIPIEGSNFELWTVHGVDGTEYLLDEQFVSEYFAAGAITITTGDSYQNVPRTRVDQPLTVQVDVRGLGAVLEHGPATTGKTIWSPHEHSISNIIFYLEEADGTAVVAKAKIEGFNDSIYSFDSTDFLASYYPDSSLVAYAVKAGSNSDLIGFGEGEMVILDSNYVAADLPDTAPDAEYLYDDLLLDGGEPDTSPSGDPDNNSGNNVGGTFARADTSRVRLIHKAYTYSEGSHQLDGSALENGALVGEVEIDTEGTHTMRFHTSLTAEDLANAEGEEVFTLVASAGQQVASTIIDSRRIQIWPVAQAAISGIDAVTEYETVPPVTIALRDLYPTSTTYLRLYPGAPSSSPVDTAKVSDSVVVIRDAVPQDRTLVLPDLDEFFTEHGTYTLEVMHETAFGLDLLAQQTVQIDRTINARVSLFTKD